MNRIADWHPIDFPSTHQELIRLERKARTREQNGAVPSEG
jgi:hypothetical protein